MASGGDYQEHAGPGSSSLRFIPIVLRVLTCQALNLLTGRGPEDTSLRFDDPM